MKKSICLWCIFALLAGTSKANNIQLTNVSIINGGPGLIRVKFDVSWDNSWRTNIGPSNYDAAWVFFKYKTTTGVWTQLTLTGSNNLLPAGFDIYQTTDVNKVGAMIFRDAGNMGTGSVSATNIELGVINALPYSIDVRGFAVEMVYVPATTSFGNIRNLFGDGNGTTESVNAFHYLDNTATTSTVVPMQCDANSFDDTRLTSASSGIWTYTNDTIQLTNPLGTLDPFPTMKSLWCMKYELSQAGYRDFLNTLTYDQQLTRTAFSPSNAIGSPALVVGSRNFLKIASPGTFNTVPAVYGCDAGGNNIFNEATDGEWVACNYLSWMDMAAYLDWSGLAPMSEVQYEHMCRGVSSAGPNPAILGEYAWGTNTIFASGYALSSANTSSENAFNTSGTVGNAAYITTASSGPLRNGIFATGASNRISSGAGFYGIMEMSGNISEYCTHLGSVAGRSCYMIPNGDGTISAAGNALLSNGTGYWPGMNGNNSLSTANTCAPGPCEVTGGAGIRLRGGSVSDAASALAIADRSIVVIPNTRGISRGGRGVLYFR